jgi:hypothetical protein
MADLGLSNPMYLAIKGVPMVTKMDLITPAPMLMAMMSELLVVAKEQPYLLLILHQARLLKKIASILEECPVKVVLLVKIQVSRLQQMILAKLRK